MSKNNLIDLSADETQPSLMTFPPLSFDRLTLLENCDSPGNNPFDIVQKQVDRYNDPFEILLTAQQQDSTKSENVRTQNLLNIDEPQSSPSLNESQTSCADNSFKKKNCRVQSESDILQKRNKTNHKSTDSIQKSSSLDLQNSFKKNHLLKLSLSNSSILQSPSSNNASPSSQVFLEANLLSQKCKTFLGGNVSTDSSFDDLMATCPNFVDSDNDSDIEQMNIPFFNNYYKTTEAVPSKDEDAESNVNNLKKNHQIIEQFQKHKQRNSILPNSSTDLTDASNAGSNENVLCLLKNLKLAVKQSENDENKTEAETLLERLNSIYGQNSLADDADSTPPPPTVVRQGTFNVELDDEGQQPKKQITFAETDNVSNVVQRLEKVLGKNAAISVLQTKINDLLVDSKNSPTFILVVDGAKDNFKTPSPPSPQDRSVMYDDEGMFPPKAHRSKSLHLHEKPSAAIRAIQHKAEQSSDNFTTPQRPSTTGRRNSFSVQRATDRKVPARRSIYQSPPLSTALKCTPRKSILKEPESFKYSKIKSTIGQQSGLLASKQLKVRVAETTRPSGPMRATVPIKRVAPVVAKQLEVPTEPYHYKSTPKKPSANATPMRRLTSLLPKSPAMPPKTELKTPSRNRMSYLSAATPNPKPIVTHQPTGRRRSLTDFKVLSKPAADSVVSQIATPMRMKHQLSLLPANKENKVPNHIK